MNTCEYQLHLLIATGEVAPDEVVSGPGWMDVVETLYCEAPATVEVMGERDSFGFEILHFCEGCYPAFVAMLDAKEEADKIGECQWCHMPATDRREFGGYEAEDWESWLVCGDCRQIDRERMQQDLDDYYGVEADS